VLLVFSFINLITQYLVRYCVIKVPTTVALNNACAIEEIFKVFGKVYKITKQFSVRFKSVKMINVMWH
jgi:hypothetical protein